jgi:hypothetical protein
MLARPSARPFPAWPALAALACLLAPASANAAGAYRLQAPEMFQVPASIQVRDMAAGDVNDDSIPEIAVFESDRRVHVFERASGAWAEVYASTAGASLTNPANATPTVRFTDEPYVSPGPGFGRGQFLFNAQAPGVEIVSIRRSTGGTWSEQVLFGPLGFIADNGAFSPPVRLPGGGSSVHQWRLVVPGGDLFDPPYRAYLPVFGESAPYVSIVRGTSVSGGYCEQATSEVPDALGFDSNGDGHNEVALLRYNAILIGNSDTAPYGGNTGCWPYTPIALPNVLPAHRHVQMLAGRFDSDTREDLVVRDDDGTLRLVILLPTVPPLPLAVTTLPRSTPASAISTDVAAADLDGDGDLDLVQAYQSPPGYEVLLNDGTGTFTSSFIALDPTYGAVSALAVLDTDHDGHADLVLAQTSAPLPRVLVLPGMGNGTFGMPAGYPLGTLEPSVILAADFDGSLGIDVAVGGHDTDLSDGMQAAQVFYNQGGGAFDPPLLVDASFTPGPIGIRRMLAVRSDLANPSSLPDLLAIEGPQVGLGVNNGFTAIYPMNVIESSASDWTGLDEADLDGDRVSDAILLTVNPDLSSTIELAATYAIPLADEHSGIRAVDWNHDGRPDLVTLNRTLHRVEVRYQDPATPFSFPTLVTYPLALEPVTTGDHAAPFIVIDEPGGAGDRAIVVRGWSSVSGNSQLEVFHNHGSLPGTLYDAASSPAGFPCALVAGDLDGDGLPDLVVGEVASVTGESYATVLRGLSTNPITFTRSASFVLPGTTLNDLAVADITGDGHDDLVWATSSTQVPTRPGARPAAAQAAAGGRIVPVLARPVPTAGTTDVPHGSSRPGTLALAVSPNPLPGDSGRLSFVLPAKAHVVADLLDISGRRVRRVLEGDYEAGDHLATLALREPRGAPLGAGVYFVQMRAGSEAVSRTVVLLH